MSAPHSSRVLLLFPPGWTACAGSPHLALPLLASFLAQHGFEVEVNDLNFEFVQRIWPSGISAARAKEACRGFELEEMNTPYFEAEACFERVAAEYAGEWNIQQGYMYAAECLRNSSAAIQAAAERSPYTTFFHAVVLPRIAREAWNVIGLTVASINQLIPALELCTLLRRVGYDGTLVLGGNTISRLRDELSTEEIFGLVDALVSFEGERPLLAVAREPSALRRRVPVANASSWDGNGVVHGTVETGNVAPVAPPPSFDGLPVGQYWGVNYLPLVAWRGCYYGRCAFCAIPFGWSEDGFAGSRRASAVFADMCYLADRYGTSRFKFVDEAMNPALMRELSQLITANGREFEWEAYTRFEPPWADHRFVEALAAAGFRKAYFGLEVLPSQNREVLNKKDRVDIDGTLDCLRAFGVRNHLFCMFGFPGTSIEDAKRTAEYLVANAESIDTADLFPWTLTKHTDVPGVRPRNHENGDLLLEFEHEGIGDDALDSSVIREATQELEEAVWRSRPRLLHPTYRLVSPWLNGS